MGPVEGIGTPRMRYGQSRRAGRSFRAQHRKRPGEEVKGASRRFRRRSRRWSSVVTMDLAARISTERPSPDGAPCEAGNVSICNVEDDAGDTIVSRLKAHSADLSRIFLFSEVPDGKGGKRLLELPKDIEALAVKVEERQAVLLILGSVITLLGSDVNEDQDARQALAPVKSMAERLGVAIVGVRHLNKSVNLSAIQSGGGNMGLIGVARIGAFFAHHPEQEGMRVMAPHKSNPAENLGSSLQARQLRSARRRAPRRVARRNRPRRQRALAWPREKSVLDEAVEFLRDEPRDGPRRATEVSRSARDAGDLGGAATAREGRAKRQVRKGRYRRLAMVATDQR